MTQKNIRQVDETEHVLCLFLSGGGFFTFSVMGSIFE